VLSPHYDGREGQSSQSPDPGRPDTDLDVGRVRAGMLKGVFRRRSAGAPEVLEEDPQAQDPDPEALLRPGLTQAKGRPTPKRSEAERRRRQPFTAPGDRKAAGKQARERTGADRARRQAAMKRGEEWALLAKDKGPVRKLVRDYVDSRRGLSEYSLFGLMFFAVLLFIPALHQSALLIYLVYALLLVMVLESVLVSRRAIKLVQQRFPGESTRGLRWYATARGAMIRRMRIPAPQVKPGDKI
jgi:hypothetical protein